MGDEECVISKKKKKKKKINIYREDKRAKGIEKEEWWEYR